MVKTVCFGEIMGRLNPPGYQRFAQASQFEISYSGGEANVALSLANFGCPSAFVTKLPENDIAECAVRFLKSFGVETESIARGGERLGLYYIEKGASQRPSKVIYDRKYSAISEASPEDFDWDKIFEGAGWFHFTGITPALGERLPEICLEAVKTARKKGLIVSCDLNYRKNLWSREKAGEIMGSLMPYVDVCIANEEDAADVFGIKAVGSDLTSGRLSREGYMQVASALKSRFGFSKVAITLRGSISASENRWGAMLYDGREFCFSKEYLIHIVDRVGGGDSFGAGLIYSMINGFSSQDAVEFAAAASCLKHTIENDVNLSTKEEVQRLMRGDGSGRVQR